MEEYSVFDVADWFLNKESMTPKKLQKLSYYFEAWGHALFNQNFIKDTQFQAWVHGPVSPDLYNKYRDYGWNYIPKIEVDNSDMFEREVVFLLESVWETYGDKSANELEALTHSESPWINARKGLESDQPSDNVISSEDMHSFYKSIYIGD